jgi:hypothetical protein
MHTLDNHSQMVENLDSFILDKEMRSANELRESSAILLEKMFSGELSLEENKVNHEKLLEKMKDFESTICNYVILNFLYADIARVALNCYRYDEAMSYAQAGLEVNLREKDEEGVTVNNRVMLDIATLMNANGEALKLFNKFPELADPRVKKMFEEKIANGITSKDIDFRKLFKRKKRPKSLKICMNSELLIEEKILRMLMNQMGISRVTALKYRKQAMKHM